MNRIMNEVEGFTFEGILKLAEEKWGRKQTMEMVDILYLHHLTSRGICGRSEDELKRFLMKEGNDTRTTLRMIKRYNSVKEDLFKYDWRTQSIMDRIQSYGDSKSITSWETIDGKVIGLVKEDQGYKVVDISDGKERLLARINEGIFWVDTNLTNRQMNYITKNGRILKSNHSGVL